MSLLKQAATSSLAALMLVFAAGQLKADHDSWSGVGRGIDRAAPRDNNWFWTPQPARPARARPGSTSDEFFNWFRPLAELPRLQNIDPEAGVSRAPVIFTYRADPKVDLADAALTRPAGLAWQAMRWRADSRVPHAIFEALKSGSSGVRVTEQQRDAIVAFYSERDFAPVWASTSGGGPRATDVLAKLSEAAAYGLEPADYLPLELGSFSDDLGALAGDRERLARFDLALTAAALSYAMHASGGRIVPSRLSAYHDLNPPTVDVREALTRLASEPSPAAYLASLHPVHPAYEAFRKALADLRAVTDPDDEPIAEGPAIKPGGTDARMPAIQARLAKLGHLAPATASEEKVSQVEVAQPITIESGAPLFGSAESVVVVEVDMIEAGDGEPARDPVPADREAYDAETVQAVKAFQAAAGLSVDGVIGQKTITALNSGSTEERIRRLVYNMERLRWMPRDFGAKHVLVNTASFEAKAVEDGSTIWSSKVIVGTPQNQTAFFSDQMETVVFNPYWGVPASIIVNEMLPEIYRDPSWLDREGYEVTDLNGQVISSYGVDWYNLNPKNLSIGVRQPPGPSNALGEIKFLFPNKHSIYMHDTPSKPLFAKPVRAYSHGCVRVEKPWEFAEIILGWDQQRIASTRATTRDYSVPVEDEIKVHIAYLTAWPDETGTMRYFDDVYGRDLLLERAFGTLVLAMR